MRSALEENKAWRWNKEYREQQGMQESWVQYFQNRLVMEAFNMQIFKDRL